MGINKNRPKEISFDQDSIEASFLISLDDDDLLLDGYEYNLLLDDPEDSCIRVIPENKINFTENHNFYSDLVVEDLIERKNEILDLSYEKISHNNGKRLNRYFFSLWVIAFFVSFFWFYSSSIDSNYLNSLSFISEGLEGSRKQQTSRHQKDKSKLKQTFDLRNKKLIRVKRRKKKVAKIELAMKKAHVGKPRFLLTENDKETILKEIEILRLEARLDPFSARKDLINLKINLKDKDLKKVIDNVLRQI